MEFQDIWIPYICSGSFSLIGVAIILVAWQRNQRYDRLFSTGQTASATVIQVFQGSRHTGPTTLQYKYEVAGQTYHGKHDYPPSMRQLKVDDEISIKYLDNNPKISIPDIQFSYKGKFVRNLINGGIVIVFSIIMFFGLLSTFQ